MMNERPLTVESAKASLTQAAADAERARWRYVNLRCPYAGNDEAYPSSAAERAYFWETYLWSHYNLFTSFGVIDADNADRIVAAERVRVREELDAKWLMPRTEDDGIPE